MTKVTFLNRAEFAQAEESRLALAKSKPEGQQFASLSDVLRPGSMWEVPWSFDPAGDEEMQKRRLAALANIAAGSPRNFHLSRFYWETWSTIRPPLCVLCPNGREWCVDAKSSNGEGWVVTGSPPLITAAPSIAVPGYHGFLQNGEFTPDLDAATR